MTTALALLLLAAAPKPLAELQLAAPDFGAANVKPEVVKVATEHFARQLGQAGPKVITSAEIANQLGIERQKALAGCDETSASCLLELGNALGADGVVTGSLGRFGDSIVVNVKVVGANGEQRAVYSGTAASESWLPAELEKAAASIADQLRPPASPGASRAKVLVPSVAGGALLVGSGVFLVLGSNSRARIGSAGDAPQVAFEAKRAGEAQLTTSAVLGAVGVAALATGAVFYFTRESAPVALVPSPSGVAVVGAFP